jgi:SCY1-like protein 2
MDSNANRKSNLSALDKYTMQEKIVPLIRAIKTKEPAVMIAALNVLRQVGGIADTDFVAMDILPILWSMSLGPLLNLQQFQSFISLITSLSARVEQEQTKKLQELSSSTGGLMANQNNDFMSFDGTTGFPSSNGGHESAEDDFERLVQGKASNGGSSSNSMDAGWDTAPANASTQSLRNTSAPNIAKAASFAWSTPSPTTPVFSGNSMGTSNVLRPQQAPTSRTVTPNLSRFDALTPSTTQFSQPLQPQTKLYTTPLQPQPLQSFQSQPSSVNWAAATSNPWGNVTTASNPSLSSMASLGDSMSNMSMGRRPAISANSSFSLPPPPTSMSNAFSLPQQSNTSSAVSGPSGGQAKPKGLDAYESLL